MSPLFFQNKKRVSCPLSYQSSLFKYLIYKYSQNVPFLSNNLKKLCESIIIRVVHIFVELVVD